MSFAHPDKDFLTEVFARSEKETMVCLQSHNFPVIVDKWKGFLAVTVLGLFFFKSEISKCEGVSKIRSFHAVYHFMFYS